MKKIVILGGGTGASVVLRSLKNFPLNLAAIVSTADDGGSSGLLRSEYNILPVGDIRQCLLALSHASPEIISSMSHRFSTGSQKGHVVGNLVLAGLLQQHSPFESLKIFSEMLVVSGSVIPVTDGPITLGIRTIDGTEIIGEQLINEAFIDHSKITSPAEIFFIPSPPAVNHNAFSVIDGADFIIIGPGSFYTSLLAVLLSPICSAIKSSNAKLIFIANLSVDLTKSPSTSSSVAKLESLLGRPFDLIIDNPLLASSQVITPIIGDLIIRSTLRHDEEMLGALLWEIISSVSVSA